MSSDCNACKKRFFRMFIISVCDLKIADIAEAVHVSQDLVYKHLAGKRNCPMIDAFLANYIFNIVKGEGS